MNRQSAIAGLLALLALLALVGCSGGDDDDDSEVAGTEIIGASESTNSTPTNASDSSPSDSSGSTPPANVSDTATATDTEPVNEDALAQAILLTVNDFPAGWSEDTTAEDDEDEESPFDKCARDQNDGRTGEAETGDFSPSNTPSISQTVVVYESPEKLNLALDQMTGLVACMTSVMQDGGLDDDEFEVTDVKSGPVSFASIGDRTEAYRLTAELSPRDDGISVSFHIDIIYLSTDRVGMNLVGLDLFTPTDTSLLEGLANTAIGKAEAALAQ